MLSTIEFNQKVDEFIAKNNNKQIEAIDPASPFQCFDLIVAFCDYLGIPRQAGGNSIFPFWGASQIYTDFGALQATYFDRFPNTPDAISQKGDILVWRGDYPSTGGAGHTAVDAGGSTLYSIRAFSQNNPKYRTSVLASFPYDYVLGWLRFKTVAPPTYPHEDLAKKAMQSALNEVTTASQAGDPNFKVNMSVVKIQAQKVVDML